MAVPIDGCDWVDNFAGGPFGTVSTDSEAFPEGLAFDIGDLLEIYAAAPNTPPDGSTIRLRVRPFGAEEWLEAGEVAFGATLSYSIPATDAYDIWWEISSGNVTWTGSCSEGQTIDPGPIIFVVEGLELPNGTENSFVKKLNNASKSLDKGDTDGACEKLASFISQVNAQEGKKLDLGDAAELRDAAQAVIEAIQCDGA